ncbi:MAG: DEAD/DEAH box helicase family protein, partial [Sandaracinaceae bacterium]|nr:DEAD/DEAH box helicase family protein [Sandaracinaceae bacterium]
MSVEVANHLGIITAYHAKYYALDLAKRGLVGEVDSVGTALFDAQVDLNPHQIEAALVGIEASADRGRILADEVGLGKTIEAALVLSQRWAERKQRLLVIAPASLRKQWAQGSRRSLAFPRWSSTHAATREPFLEAKAVVIASYQYAARRTALLTGFRGDLIVIDEAHRLRNAWRSDSRLGKPLLAAVQHAPKLLLTATPLQNSLLELYGIVSVVYELAFGEPAAFKSAFMKGTPDYEALRQRIQPTVHRTLRKSVLPYIQYTARRSMTWRFTSSPAERELYKAVSDFLARDETHQSPAATARTHHNGPAQASRVIDHGHRGGRANSRQARKRHGPRRRCARWVADEAWDEDWLDDLTDIEAPVTGSARPWSATDEVAELDRLLAMARAIDVDRRALALVEALGSGFTEMRTLGASEKAVIFTESRRTQAWLKTFLEAHGYAGRI